MEPWDVINREWGDGVGRAEREGIDAPTRQAWRHPSTSGPDSAALAVQAACERTYRELTRTAWPKWVRALLTRALAQAQAEHPLLKEIRVGRGGLDGVTAAVQAHGAPAVAAALEAVLETLLDLLGRLIGDDMVARLVEQSAPDRNAR